jgi:hypothetical protein
MAASSITPEQFFFYDETSFDKEELLAFASDQDIEVPNPKLSTKKLHDHIRRSLLEIMLSRPPNREYSYHELIAMYEELGGNGEDLHNMVYKQVNLKYNTVHKVKKLPPPISSVGLSSSKSTQTPSGPSSSSRVVPMASSLSKSKPTPSGPSKPKPTPSSQYISSDQYISSSRSAVVVNRGSNSQAVPLTSSSASIKMAKAPSASIYLSKLLRLYNRRSPGLTESERDSLELEIAETQSKIDKVNRDRLELINNQKVATTTFNEMNSTYGKLDSLEAFSVITDIYGGELTKRWLGWRIQNDYHDAVLDAHYQQMSNISEVKADNETLHYFTRSINVPLDVEWNFADHFGGSHDLIELILEDVLSNTDISYSIFYDKSEQESLLMVELSADHEFDAEQYWTLINDKLSNHHLHRFITKNKYNKQDIGSIREIFRLKIRELLSDKLGVYFGVMFDGELGYLVILTNDQPITEETIELMNEILSGKMRATLKR